MPPPSDFDGATNLPLSPCNDDTDEPFYLPTLRNIHRTLSSEDPDRRTLAKSLSLCRKILEGSASKDLPSDVVTDLRRTSFHLLIRLGSWDECIGVLRSRGNDVTPIEAAYVAYRTGDYNRCIALASEGDGDDGERGALARLHLAAQGRYRLGFSLGTAPDIDEGDSSYAHVLRATLQSSEGEDDDEVQEIMCNALADAWTRGRREEAWGSVVAERGTVKVLEKVKEMTVSEKLEDLTFNECTAALGGIPEGFNVDVVNGMDGVPSRREAAIQASRLHSLQTTLAGSSSSPPSDLAHISTQHAYALLLAGDSPGCTAACSRLLGGGNGISASELDPAVRHVASNNVAASRGIGRDLFDSYKRVRAVLQHQEKVEAGVANVKGNIVRPGRLSFQQIRIVRYNHIALTLAMGRIEECREAMEEAKRLYLPKDEGKIALLEAHILRKEKKNKKADEVLQKVLKSRNPTARTEIQLYQAQQMIDDNNISSATSLLESIEALRGFPAVTATLIAMYDELGQHSEAQALLSSVDAIPTNDGKALRSTFRSRRAAADFKLNLGMYEEAAYSYRALLEENTAPSELERRATVSGLVHALSWTDPQAAEALADKELPQLEIKEGLGGDELEKMELPRTTHRIRKLINVDSNKGRTERMKGKKPEARLQQRAKKRAAYLAKLEAQGKYNPARPPQPDPERWIPKAQRSYNKRGRRGRHKYNVGAQGAGGGTEKDAAKLDAMARGSARAAGGTGSGGPSTAHIGVASGGGGGRKGRRKR